MFFKKRKLPLKKEELLSREDFNIAINAFLDDAEKLIPEEDLPQLPLLQGSTDVHDWYEFEHQLWIIGEKIRQLIAEQHKELNKEQSDRVCDICVNKNAKRGRQSFVMLLGKKRYSDYAEKIAPLLSDDDVDGEAVNTLYKMRTSEYQELVEPLLNSNRKWIRDEAKRYISSCN